VGAEAVWEPKPGKGDNAGKVTPAQKFAVKAMNLVLIDEPEDR
jgi:hypothetical protein